MLTKFSHAASDSENGKNSIAVRVSILLRYCFPAAILWFIIFITINSSESHSVWTFTKIGQKVSKGFIPSAANSYALTVVKLWLCGSRFASHFHLNPDPIGFDSGKSMRDIALVALKTAARARVFGFQGLVHYGDYGPTITDTVTFSSQCLSRFDRGRIFNHQKPSKSLADEGLFFRHNVASSMFCQWRDSDCNLFPPRFYGMTG